MLQVIYVGRNPKDAVVSWFHHQQLDGYNKDFPTMAKMYKSGLSTFAPMIPHMIEAFGNKDRTNFYFTTYERMKENLPKIVGEVAEFMGKTLTEDQLETLLKAVHIESFRTNK